MMNSFFKSFWILSCSVAALATCNGVLAMTNEFIEGAKNSTAQSAPPAVRAASDSQSSTSQDTSVRLLRGDFNDVIDATIGQMLTGMASFQERTLYNSLRLYGANPLDYRSDRGRAEAGDGGRGIGFRNDRDNVRQQLLETTINRRMEELVLQRIHADLLPRLNVIPSTDLYTRMAGVSDEEGQRLLKEFTDSETKKWENKCAVVRGEIKAYIDREMREREAAGKPVTLFDLWQDGLQGALSAYLDFERYLDLCPRDTQQICLNHHFRREHWDLNRFTQRGFSRVPPLDRFTNVVSVEFINNSLISLVGLGSLPKLKDLNISGNQLTSLVGIEELTSLKELDASDNQLQTLKALKRLPGLEKLLLKKNLIDDDQVTDLPTSLRVINLSENRIQGFGYSIHLDRLEDLSLRGNLIKQIPQVLNHLRSLKSLDINDNPCESNDGIFAFIQQLEQRGIRVRWFRNPY